MSSSCCLVVITYTLPLLSLFRRMVATAMGGFVRFDWKRKGEESETILHAIRA